jgi:hypothetical protein
MPYRLQVVVYILLQSLFLINFQIMNYFVNDAESGHAELRRRRRKKVLFILRILAILEARKKIKNRSYLTRPALQDSKESAWIQLYNQKNDLHFINVMGLDVASFEHLADAVQRFIEARQNRAVNLNNDNNNNNNDNNNDNNYNNNNNDLDDNNLNHNNSNDSNNVSDMNIDNKSDNNNFNADDDNSDEESDNVSEQEQELENENQYDPPREPPIRLPRGKRGRPAGLNIQGKLALLLYHLHGKMDQKELCQIFGIVPATCSQTLSQMLPLVLQVLKKEPDARIQFPTHQECYEFSEQIAALHPNLPCRIWGFMDGVFFFNRNHPDPNIQNAFYNGWKSATSVTNVLVFTPDGCICWAATNRPGSWHDARVVLPLYEKLHTQTPEGYKLVADAAFQAWMDKVITPLKKNQFSSDPMRAAFQLRQHHRVVSVRQPAEWGMRALQASFQRLTVPLTASNYEYNGVLINCCLHLYNYRTRRVPGFNQIKTVFSSDYLRNLM